MSPFFSIVMNQPIQLVGGSSTGLKHGIIIHAMFHCFTALHGTAVVQIHFMLLYSQSFKQQIRCVLWVVFLSFFCKQCWKVGLVLVGVVYTWIPWAKRDQQMDQLVGVLTGLSGWWSVISCFLATIPIIRWWFKILYVYVCVVFLHQEVLIGIDGYW